MILSDFDPRVLDDAQVNKTRVYPYFITMMGMGDHLEGKSDPVGAHEPLP